MRLVLSIAIAAVALAPAAQAQTDLENGFAGALRGCEEWVLNPGSWENGVGPFVSAVGLGDKIGLVGTVSEAALPPKQYRRANHYWRINSATGAGFILVVSDQLPMCHITGGGDTDLEPVVEAVLASSGFTNRWERIKDDARGDMVTSEFRNREEPKFSMVISRAKEPGHRLDHVQVLATAAFNMAD